MIIRSFEITPALWQQLAVLAAAEGRSRGALIRETLQRKVDTVSPELRAVLDTLA